MAPDKGTLSRLDMRCHRGHLGLALTPTVETNCNNKLLMRSDHDTSLPAPLAARSLPAVPLAEDAERARAFARAATAANTKRAYRADFCAWCDGRGLSALPASPETVTLYIASRAEVDPDDAGGQPTGGLKVSTLERRLSAINQAHRQTSHDAPASRRDEPLHSVWAGITRTKGVAVDKVSPTLPDDLRHTVDALPRGEDGEWTLAARRDRALLLVGFAGALRRSEIVAVEAGHVQFTAEGMRLHLPRSKADQEGRGATLGIHYGRGTSAGPVRALRSWLRAGRQATGAPLSGPLFRKVDRWGRLWETGLTSGAVAKLVKRAASRAGLDAALYSGHSLRAGFATTAARAGKHERAIMAHTRHKSERVLREYIREGALFDENPTDGIGL